MIASLHRVLRLVGEFWRLWRKQGAPPSQTVPDFLLLRRRIDAGVNDFCSGWLWDRRLPMRERLRFLTDADRRRIEFRMNPREEQLVLRDKVASQRRLEMAGIPVPTILAIVRPGGAGANGEPVVTDRAGLERLLAEPHPDGIVCKPVFGMQGADVQVFTAVSPTTLRHIDGSDWSVDRLWAVLSRPGSWAERLGHSPDWLIQHRVPPHPVLAQVHGEVLGCVRVVTLCFDNGEIGLAGTTWKIPTTRHGVDNRRFGPLLATVDPETGSVHAALDQAHLRFRDDHPVSHQRITGLQLPEWHRGLEVARRVMTVFPRLRSLGVDLGLTARGPQVIEVNPFWGQELHQWPNRRGLVAGEFLRFLEELGAEDVIRRRARELPSG